MMYYLDSSAWVKRYYDEAGSEWVRNLFLEDALLACATLGYVEVLATLARKHKAGQIKSAQLAAMVHQVEEDWGNFVQVPLDETALDRAIHGARDLALRGADAIHFGSCLVLSQRLAEQSETLIVVSSDQELQDATRRAGLVVLDPVQKTAAPPNQE